MPPSFGRYDLGIRHRRDGGDKVFKLVTRTFSRIIGIILPTKHQVRLGTSIPDNWKSWAFIVIPFTNCVLLKAGLYEVEVSVADTVAKADFLVLEADWKVPS